MITFETQEDFEEAVKAVIRGSLGLDTLFERGSYGEKDSVQLTLELDGGVISGVRFE